MLPGAATKPRGANRYEFYGLDSYTLLLGINSTHGTNSSLYQKLSEDPVRDFVIIANPGVFDLTLVMTQDLPVHSTPKLMADGCAHPG